MKRILAWALAALCIPALMPVAAAAETPAGLLVQATTPDTWQFDAALYIYLPTIGGTTTFPEPSGGNVSVDASKILDNLKMAFMGSLGVRKGPWGAFTDVLYMDLGSTKSGTRALTVGGTPLPAGASADATFDLKGTVWTLAGSYRVTPDPGSPVDLFAGARLLDMKQTLSWQLNGNIGSIPLPGRAGNEAVSLTNWDAIVGVKGRFAFGADRKWFIPYYLDVGAGDSDLTWQAMGGAGYGFHWGEVVVAWRYLDYNMKSGGKIESVNFNGPVIAAVFHW
jgi:hypothetical protein